MACTFKICQIFIKDIIIFYIPCNCDITVTFVSTMRAFPPFTKKDFKLPLTLFHLHLFVSPAALLPSPTMTEEIAGLNLGQTIKLYSYWIGFYFPNLLIFYIKYVYLHYDDLPLSPAASLLFHALILEWQDTNTIIILVTLFVFRSTPSLCYHNSLIIRPFIKWRSSLLTIFNKVE